MNIKFTLTLLTAVLILNSCQKDLELSTDDFRSRLVVNSIFTPDSLWSITVSNTKNILDHDSHIENIDDASIFLENRSLNTDVPIVNLGNGKYGSAGVLPIEGHQYEIFVQKEGYETARSFTYVPSNDEAPKMFSIEEVNRFDEKVFKISMKIEDDPLRQNFYIWELISTSKASAGAVYKGEELDKLETYLDTGLPTNQPKSGFLTALSSDGDFNGETYRQDFFIVPNSDLVKGGDPNHPETTEIKFYLKVRSVSQDLYKFHESLKLYQSSADVNTSISSPVPIFSNIENGLGIFGSYSESIIQLEL